jgi:anti-sigma factor RsiW
MSCSPFDLKDYFLQELANPQRLEVEAHVKTCAPCREELERLRLTEAALFALREEEIPQRIAFVSDPVFEPSPWRRGWTALWNSGPRLGFASAALLSAALVVFALTRPAPAPNVAIAPAPVGTVLAAVSDADMQARIDAAVARAVGQAQTRQAQQTKQLISELDDARSRLLLASQELDFNSRRESASLITAGVYGPPAEHPDGGVK